MDSSMVSPPPSRLQLRQLGFYNPGFLRLLLQQLSDSSAAPPLGTFAEGYLVFVPESGGSPSNSGYGYRACYSFPSRKVHHKLSGNLFSPIREIGKGPQAVSLVLCPWAWLFIYISFWRELDLSFTTSGSVPPRANPHLWTPSVILYFCSSSSLTTSLDA